MRKIDDDDEFSSVDKFERQFDVNMNEWNILLVRENSMHLDVFDVLNHLNFSSIHERYVHHVNCMFVMIVRTINARRNIGFVNYVNN